MFNALGISLIRKRLVVAKENKAEFDRVSSKMFFVFVLTCDGTCSSQNFANIFQENYFPFLLKNSSFSGSFNMMTTSWLFAVQFVWATTKL